MITHATFRCKGIKMKHLMLIFPLKNNRSHVTEQQYYCQPTFF